MGHHFHRHSWRIRALAALTALVLTISLLALGRTPVAVGLFATPWDKLAHLTVFAGASALLLVGCGVRTLAGATLALLATCGLAALDELQQALLPGRNADWSDFLADIVGAFAGLAVTRLLIAKPRSGDAQASV